MLNQNHPQPERLSALAARDSDAMEDAPLNLHVGACAECSGVIAELETMRAALAELPDIAPHRPLTLIPPADEAAPKPADRLSGWVRRIFAPALTVGAALAMVGVIGTSLPALSGGASAGGADAAAEGAADASAAAGAQEYEVAASADESGGPETFGGGTTDLTDGAAPSGGVTALEQDRSGERTGGDGEAAAPAGVERSPWPMVLFAGVALMIGAVLVRWILSPTRAGQGPPPA